MSKFKLTLANRNLAGYPSGGGHWSVFMQWLLGLKDLDQDFLWLELLGSSGNADKDKRLVEIFFNRFKKYGLEKRAAILLYDSTLNRPKFEDISILGLSRKELEKLINDTDILWNFCCSFNSHLLSKFKNANKVLIDLDPGIIQIPEPECNWGINSHDLFFTVGTKMNDSDCRVPTLEKQWNTFYPPIYLPMWKVASDPDSKSPYTSITHWDWRYYTWENRIISFSKRDAYLKYINFPLLSNIPFELLVNIHPRDKTGDRELLKSHGWRIKHPYQYARTIKSYQKYIQRSRGEFGCAKPIYTELKTGWFSDRSAAYLASGRPVLAEDTGFSDYLPTGMGLVSFTNMEEALEGLRKIDLDYKKHQKAAREIANEYLDSKKVISGMLELCI